MNFLDGISLKNLKDILHKNKQKQQQQKQKQKPQQQIK